MQAFEMKVFIYAENQTEVEDCRKAIHQFIEENRQEGRAVTAKKYPKHFPAGKQTC